MKNIIGVLVVALLTLGCAATGSEDIIIDFNVSEQTSDEVVLLCHNAVTTVRLDENGHARHVISGMDAVYAVMLHMPDVNDQVLIYLEKGDEAVISFNGRDLSGTLSFEGDKSSAVKYLNDVRLTALPDEDYALPFDEYLKKINQKEKDAVKLMKANGLGKAGNFEKMEEGRIRYSFGTQLLMYPLGHRFLAGDMGYEPDASYYEVIDSYVIDHALWADLDQYRDFIIEAAHVLDAENRNVKSAYPKTIAQMRFIADRFEDGKAKEILIDDLACTYVGRYGVKDIQDMANIYRTYVKGETLRAGFEEVCGKWDLAAAGKQSPDFKAVDLNGKEYSLADFRGRYVYIDVWATWCGPCRQEIPYLKALDKKFEDAQIVFLSLSVDQDKAKWEKMVKDEELSGVQLYIGQGSSFQEAYGIAGIPRFILLDKEGRILENDMSRPSSEHTVNHLESLEGIR